MFITNHVHTRRNISAKNSSTFTIMLDPAGDSKQMGRTIGSSFERGITLQYAEKLKKILEAKYNNINVYLTRFPGEVVYPLQNANYANRLDVNLYININFYQEKSTVPSLYIYRFSYNDDFITPSTKLTFYRYDQAHILHNSIIQTWSEKIKQTLSEDPYKKLFKVQGVYKLPCKPLIGIVAPALCIEAGIKAPHDWQLYITPIAHAIGMLIENHS